MKKITIGKWNLEVDVEKTKKFYQTYPQITEGCNCLYCKNFVVAVAHLPQPVMDFFEQLGIDPTKEGEVSGYCENDDGTHLYGVFYHIVGRLISGPDCWVKTGTETSHLNTNNLINISGFSFGFTNGINLLPDGFPKPSLQLEFEGNVPWILDKE